MRGKRGKSFVNMGVLKLKQFKTRTRAVRTRGNSAGADSCSEEGSRVRIRVQFRGFREGFAGSGSGSVTAVHKYLDIINICNNFIKQWIKIRQQQPQQQDQQQPQQQQQDQQQPQQQQQQQKQLYWSKYIVNNHHIVIYDARKRQRVPKLY